MKRLMRLAARLYPAAWRARYGDEFAALLEDAGGGWRACLDVLWGAVKMQIRMGSFWKLAAGFAVAGVAIAGLIALRMPARYTSAAMLWVTGTDRDAAKEALLWAECDVLSRGSLAEIIQKLDLYKSERQRMPMEDVVQRMRHHDIRIVPAEGAGGPMKVMVRFEYPDAEAAESVTAWLAVRLTKTRGGSVDFLVADPASWPQRAPGPNRWGIVALGLAGGLAAAMLIFGIRRWPMVAACAAAVAILTGGLSFLIPDRYTSDTVLRAGSPEQAGLIDKLMGEALSQESLARIIQDPTLDLYHRERRNMTLDQVVTLMRERDLRVRQLGEGSYVLEFTYPNRYKAQQVLRELDYSLAEANLNARRFIASSSHSPEEVLRARPRPPVLELLDPPSFPERPVSPNHEVIAAIGLLTGLALGALARAIPKMHRPARPATA